MLDITMKIDKDDEIFREINNEENEHMRDGHIGTHIDVYNKTDIPMEYFRTSAVIIDCTEYEIEKEIGIEIVDNIDIKEEMTVIFKTDMIKKCSYSSEGYRNHHQLSYELIEYLISKKIAFLGIDASGIRKGEGHKTTDIKCELHNVFVIENLDLRKIKEKGNIYTTAYTMWEEDKEATALQARIILDM